MGRYEQLGMRRVINADAALTRLGGSLMPEPVLAAMADAAGSFVDIFELQSAVGKRIAQLTGNEAAYVCTGAATGLYLATLACSIGDDLHKIARLPGLPEKDEVVVYRAQRNPYDLAIRSAGARLVEVGNAIQTFPWEVEVAIGPRTAAVLFFAGEHLSRGALSLEETLAIAHARGVPVIVDAAAQLPPPENLWRFTRMGADLVIFSGGKGLHGPQSSGLILGRPELIAACAANGAPHQRLGRPMKVGKEEMVGLLAAVEWYLAQDHAAILAGWERSVRLWVEAFDGRPGVSARRDWPSEAGQPLPRALIRFDPAVCGLDGTTVRQRLWEGDPAIAVAFARPDGIFVNPEMLAPGEDRIIVERLDAVLRT